MRKISQRHNSKHLIQTICSKLGHFAKILKILTKTQKHNIHNTYITKMTLVSTPPNLNSTLSSMLKNLRTWTTSSSVWKSGHKHTNTYVQYLPLYYNDTYIQYVEQNTNLKQNYKNTMWKKASKMEDNISIKTVNFRIRTMYAF